MEDVYRHIEEHLEESLADLARLCELRSVSAQAQAIQETAEFVARLLEGMGFQTRIMPKPGGGHPVVYGELEGASPKTLVFYNHYDVQPPEPLEQWSSPPFKLTRRDDKLYARGVADDKGDLVSRLAALRALQAVRGRAPVNIKFCIEGDEEIGSPSLGPFVLENRHLLKGDACIWEGASVDWEGALLVYAGAKGLLYVQLEARGANRDVHSSWGTVIPNPAWRLVWALATLKDADERILVDGFYDDALPPTQEEEAAIKSLPADEDDRLRALSLPSFLKGVRGIDYHRRHLFESTCTIDGLTSGYQGEGAKTVLPATASAKLDFRLVPEQNPDEVLGALRRHLDRHGFQDIGVVPISGERPVRTPLSSPFLRLVCRTAEEVYGQPPRLLPNMAGTGPMYHFVRDLGLPTTGAGVGYPDSRAHAPDENIRVGDFILGTKHVAAILEGFARE
jgi:acetylornithine deacetylase/succinyl-diaminopimelate desuccinylase-like protein